MTFKKFVTLAFLIFCFDLVVSGQIQDSLKLPLASLNTTPGTINWKLPGGLSELIEQYKTVNFKEPGLDGYRVQVFSDGGNNARDRASKIQSELENSFPEMEVYLSYQQPNFKVRCGNFRTKAEARRCQLEIMKEFPGCFIVRDMIRTLPD
ncbi:MAG: SPOR domain-containing protein [Bacteroidia bacterium]